MFEKEIVRINLQRILLEPPVWNIFGTPWIEYFNPPFAWNIPWTHWIIYCLNFLHPKILKTIELNVLGTLAEIENCLKTYRLQYIHTILLSPLHEMFLKLFVSHIFGYCWIPYVRNLWKLLQQKCRNHLLWILSETPS